MAELKFPFRFDLGAYELAFQFLDDLRDSGTVNMAGATPHLMDEMGMDYDEKPQARALLMAWMNSFDLGENPEDRALAVYSKQEAANAA